MSKLIMVWIAFGSLILWANSAGAASLETQQTPPPAASGDATAGGGPNAATPRKFSLEDFIRAAKKNGYEPSVVGDPDGADLTLKLTKLGKTTKGYGILDKKWDERDTIDLMLGRHGDGLSVARVNRDLMVKPPIGDWIKQPSDQVPAWVLAPSING